MHVTRAAVLTQVASRATQMNNSIYAILVITELSDSMHDYFIASRGYSHIATIY